MPLALEGPFCSKPWGPVRLSTALFTSSGNIDKFTQRKFTIAKCLKNGPKHLMKSQRSSSYRTTKNVQCSVLRMFAMALKISNSCSKICLLSHLKEVKCPLRIFPREEISCNLIKCFRLLFATKMSVKSNFPIISVLKKSIKFVRLSSFNKNLNRLNLFNILGILNVREFFLAHRW